LPNICRARIFEDALLKPWLETFHTRRPELLKKYESQVDQLIVNFTDSLLTVARDIHPAIDEALQYLRENILGLRTKLRDEGATIFEGINKASKDAHRVIKPTVLAAWEDIYEQCGAECGKGLFHRNKKAHREHVHGDGGEAMYEAAGEEIRETLDSVLENLQEKFDLSYGDAVTQLREDLNLMVESHSADPVKTALSPDASLAKERLQRALQPHFEELEQAWGIEPEVEKPHVDAAPESRTAEPVLEADSEGEDIFNPDDWL
jgi:hypothetical protein